MSKATSEQLDYFLRIFDREVEREKELINRGKLYLTIITACLALYALVGEQLEAALRYTGPLNFLFAVSLLSTFCALVLAVQALGIYRYTYPSDPTRIIHEGNEIWPNNEQFYLERIVELAAAFDSNHPINERRATKLRHCSYALVAGLLLQGVVFGVIKLS